MAVVAAAAPPGARGKRGILRRSLRPLAYLWCPTGLLILFFLVPMVIMLKISFHHVNLATCISIEALPTSIPKHSTSRLNPTTPLLT